MGYLKRSTHGILWICFNFDSFREDALKHAQVFKELAMSFQQFPIVYIDTKVYEEHVREELRCTDFPMLVLQVGNFTSEDAVLKRYRMMLEKDNLTVESIAAWMKAVLEGKIVEDDDLDDLDDVDDEDYGGEERNPNLDYDNDHQNANDGGQIHDSNAPS